MYEIIDSVPTPTRRMTGGQHGAMIYPFRNLEVGQSFIVPASAENERSLRVCASASGQRLGRRFHVTKLPDGSFQAWRSE